MRRRPGDSNKSNGQTGHREEGRLSRMKRMLADSLLLGRRAATPPLESKHFGVRLQDIALSPEGVPAILVRLCTFLENHGLQCEDLFSPSGGAGSIKLADRLRASLEKRWEAVDLDSAGDVFTAALLLTVWLKELPEPIIWPCVASELLTIHEKMHDEEATTWRQSVSAVVCTLPDVNIRLLQYLLRFLHRYCVYQQQQKTVSSPGTPRPATLTHLGAVFAPLLILKGLDQTGETVLANQLTARLIQDQTALFHQWLIDNPLSTGRQRSSGSKKRNTPSCLAPADGTTQSATSNSQRKRKERNESSGSNQSLERKVIRSSSEERRVETTKPSVKNDIIRRVSSHEDFLSTKRASKSTRPVLPLHESNHVETRRKPGTPLQVSDAPFPQHERSADVETEPLIDDSVHEQRRSTERFSRALIPPRALGRRNRRKKLVDTNSRSSESDGNASSKENDECGADVSRPALGGVGGGVAQKSPTPVAVDRFNPVDSPEPVPVEAVGLCSLIDESHVEPTHTFLQLHTSQERERSPSPSLSPCSPLPPLDLSTLHQNVDGSEAIASRASWSFAHSRQQDENERAPMLSPRNSMILPHRSFLDHNVPPSPPREHAPSLPGASRELDNYAKRLSKQVVSIKKKLKRYEEGFEREFGYRPSQSDKMSNKDTKRLCVELSKLRKEIKQIKEDPILVMGGFSDTSNASELAATSSLLASMEDTVNEVQRRLLEKRRSAGRPDALEDMTTAQQAAEKLATQKSLLFLEKIHGRAQTKADRELVRPLYDRYRALKRVVARCSSSKLMENVNELATIHEHEAMDFTPSSAIPGAGTAVAATAAATAAAKACAAAVATTPVTSSTKEQPSSSSQSESKPDDGGDKTNDPGKGADPKISVSASFSAQSSVEEASDSQTSSSDSVGENLHALPLSDLIHQMIQTREEKSKLKQRRRLLEDQIFLSTGRLPLKEERTPTSSEYGAVYSSYKQVKAKLRLLDALVAKHRKLQRME